MALRFPRTMVEFEERFATEAACRDYLFGVRWPEGWRCPHCAASDGWRNRRGLIECRRCGHHSSVTAGTVFHGTKTPLRLWFKAIFLMVTQKNGVSAKALQHFLGLSYPTAWTWLQKLRRAMARRPHVPLTGAVEVDDAYWGGHREGEPGRQEGGGNKDLLVVAVEDKGATMGRARLTRVADHKAESFSAALDQHVARGSRVHTDGLSSWGDVPAKGYVHAREVIGSDRRGSVTRFPHVHRVISLLKRWLLGTHQGAPSTKHLDAYLEEFEFRFNRRTATHRSLLFERLVGLAIRQPAPPYWRIIERQRPDQPLPVAVT